MSCPRPNVPNLNAKNMGDLHEPLRSRLWTAKIDAQKAGLILYLVSGARSAGQQWDLRHDRCPGRECDPSCKGHPTTALPGHSHHENSGPYFSAADMGGALSWLHQHAADYAIYFPVPGEAWHAEPTHADPRVRIIQYPGTGTTPPPPPPEEFFDMDEATFRKVLTEVVDGCLAEALSATAKNQVAQDVRSIKRHAVVGDSPDEKGLVPERLIGSAQRTEKAANDARDAAQAALAAVNRK